MKHITLATIKSFIKKNKNTLHINCRSSFDGMVDCVMPCSNGTFSPIQETEDNIRNSLGIAGAWFVTRSRDYFEVFDANGFTGYEITNCCGSFTLAVPSEKELLP